MKVFARTTNHEYIGDGTEDVEVGIQVFSSVSVSMVNTPLSPSQSDEDRFSHPPWRF